jgi:hypothetical protein
MAALFPPFSMRPSLLKTACFVSALGLLAGCSSVADKAAENAIEKETGGQANVDTDNGTMHVETSEGTFDAGGNKLPADWPSDAPIYTGATIQYAASANPTTGKAGAAVVFMTSDSVQKVSDFYVAQLKEQGWKIEGTVNAGGALTIGATKDERSLSLVISGAEGRTTVTMGVENKQ